MSKVPPFRPQDFTTIKDAAHELGLSENQVRRLADRGDLEMIRLPSSERLIRKRSVRAERRRREREE